jgi:uncharacterized protein
MKRWTWREAFQDALEGADSGIPLYQTFVGYCYCNGKGIKKNFKQAKLWWERAAKKGEVHAIFNLALMNDLGLGVKTNPSIAVRHYKQAAMRGDAQAQTNLAVMLLDGNGTKQDIPNGLHWMRKAAYRGDPVAQYNLGKAYTFGEDLRKTVGMLVDGYQRLGITGM